MAHFDVRLETGLSAPTAWHRILDLRAHGAVIPLTTLSGDALDAAGLAPGSRFVARTALGPVGVDDRMVVDEISPPTDSSAGHARIRKEGNIIRGIIYLHVNPAPRGSIVEWSQDISVRGLPPLLDPIVARAARTAYSRTLHRLLDREP